jgi:hypothetical protein
MTYPTFEQLLNRVWPRNTARNVNTALDEHEQHYGLHHTEQDIEQELGR